ncbi:alpha/beta hydrolase [Geomicrobium sediminis]|uniref:Dienelactone hydrolase n=1 Tax=Geomicrobium sediminis TaxID=1347788 RepID=A0ABS2PHE7_9BACL|nr:acyl-CoA thioester hydrolase/BAAT C-terminal domain-containing protein [Geomicrobium sediminis]MBM7634863.1 dienelactone hydrolase [Geomicrobium sediminis]
MIEQKVRIEIQEESTLVTECVSLQIETGDANKSFRIAISTKDDRGHTFVASIDALTDEQGSIKMHNDLMRLIESMRSKDGKERMFVKHSDAPVTFELELMDDDKVIAKAMVTRTFLKDDIQKEVIEDKELVGTVYYPHTNDPLPAIVIVGGSDGAHHESAAALLASKGYVVMALAYFGKAGLPKGIVNIPLEYVDNAFTYLKEKTIVDNERLAMIGHSRGSELALLYASSYSSLKAVVGVAPSAVQFSGIQNFQPVAKPAWTYNGESLSYFAAKQTFSDMLSFFGHMIKRKPFSGLEAIERNLADQKQYEEHLIPVEKIDASVMLVAGTDDHVQPAVFFSELMEKKLQHHSKSKVHVRIQEGAGHFSAFPSHLPHLPQTLGDTNAAMSMIFGGTREANAEATIDSWDETLTFLEECL